MVVLLIFVTFNIRMIRSNGSDAIYDAKHVNSTQLIFRHRFHRDWIVTQHDSGFTASHIFHEQVVTIAHNKCKLLKMEYIPVNRHSLVRYFYLANFITFSHIFIFYID